MLRHQKLQYYCDLHAVIFEKSLKNILVWFLRFFRPPDDDRFLSKHVAFQKSKCVLLDGLICIYVNDY
jgi:hypothetical protein